jgi:hypothetical protein
VTDLCGNCCEERRECLVQNLSPSPSRKKVTDITVEKQWVGGAGQAKSGARGHSFRPPFHPTSRGTPHSDTQILTVRSTSCHSVERYVVDAREHLMNGPIPTRFNIHPGSETHLARPEGGRSSFGPSENMRLHTHSSCQWLYLQQRPSQSAISFRR